MAAVLPTPQTLLCFLLAYPVARALSSTRDYGRLKYGAPGARGPRILFVGGNPGVARFYGSAAAALADRVGGDVCVLGLRGFTDVGDRRPLSWCRDAVLWALGRPRGCFSVEAQIQHARNHIEAEAAACAEQKRDLVVVGHSIGGFFALKALEGAGVRAKTVCVSPYLENSPEDPDYQSVARIVQSPLAPLIAVAAGLAAAAVGLLPMGLRKRVLLATGETAGMDDGSERCTAEAMCAFANVFTMGALCRDEMRVLSAPFEGPWPDHLVVFDDPPDKWCPARSPVVARARRSGVPVSVVPGAPHAFATRRESRDAVLDRVVDAIKT